MKSYLMLRQSCCLSDVAVAFSICGCRLNPVKEVLAPRKSLRLQNKSAEIPPLSSDHSGALTHENVHVSENRKVSLKLYKVVRYKYNEYSMIGTV